MTRYVCLAVLLAVCVPGLFAAEDFYEQQLRAGKTDFFANQFVRAGDELRIAAFGFLDRPVLLEEALVRLIVVRQTLGQTNEMKKTIDRFLSIEQRFPKTYAAVNVEPQVRSAFEQLLSSSVPRATLLSIPALASVANYEVRKIAQLPEAQRIPAYEAGARRDPANVEWPLAIAREFATKNNQDEVIRWGTRALEIDSGNRDARALVAHAHVSRHECAQAMPFMTAADRKQHPELSADAFVCLVQAARYSEAQPLAADIPDALKRRTDVQRASEVLAKNMEKVAPRPAAAPASTVSTADLLDLTHNLVHEGKFEDAYRRLHTAVDADPGSRPLRLALLEAAVLSKEWKTAVAQVAKVSPLAAGEEIYMFYSSVALYENGQKDEARPLMERARNRMAPSPMVNYYVKTILGEAD